MELEDYLIEQWYQINAINRTCKLIRAYLENNYDNISNKYIADEILTMNSIIQSIAYCMRLRRSEYYKKIEESYDENIDYETIMFDVYQ